MRKLILRMVMMLTLTMASMTANGQSVKTWENVLNAIIAVESKGNPKAVDKSGTCVGILQIKKCLVDEVNNILKQKKDKRRFSYADRYNPQRSKEMFVILQNQFNREHNVEKAIRSWNAGFYYEQKYGKAAFNRKTNGYYNKVKKHLK
jgi:soluble lytic murein transglycosylase-like protein